MNVEETAGSIRRMEIRGAGQIARAAAEALKQIAVEHRESDLEGLRRKLTEGREALLSSRPTAVSLWNAVQWVLRGTDEIREVGELRETIIRRADEFVTRSRTAVERIGVIGARRIRDGDRLLTHCNSSAALSVIRKAHREGKKVEVIATESRPWRQGLITVRQLADEGIPVTLIVDSAVRWVMRGIDAVLVGADTITSNGVVINKIGTSLIALAADEARVPFMVCAETYKFSPRTMFGELVEIEERDRTEVVRPGEIPDEVDVLNPVFDATSPEYIDSIITEIGLMSPYSSYEIIVRELGHEFLFEDSLTE